MLQLRCFGVPVRGPRHWDFYANEKRIQRRPSRNSRKKYMLSSQLAALKPGLAQTAHAADCAKWA